MSNRLPSLTPGTVVAGRFRIEKKIGEGGFGAVFLATQLNLDRPVALKVLQPGLVAHEESIARFHREAKLAQRLEHPNTVRLFDFGRGSDGVPFIAWELLNGQALEALVKRGALPPARVARIASQVLKSLMEAHARGVVHRDIKPANIFVCDFSGEPDFVKVLDFGIAKALRQDGVGTPTTAGLTQAGHALGTPYYMAPEQVAGAEVGPAADLYALGLVMSEMLTGQVVMKGDSAIGICMEHLSPAPVPHAPEVLRSPLGPVIHRATQKTLDRRYGSAADMLRDLEAVAQAGASSGAVRASAPGAPSSNPLAFAPTNVFAAGAAGSYGATPSGSYGAAPSGSYGAAPSGSYGVTPSYPGAPMAAPFPAAPPHGGPFAPMGQPFAAQPAPRAKGASGCSMALIAMLLIGSLVAGTAILGLVFWMSRAASVPAQNDGPKARGDERSPGGPLRDLSAESLVARIEAAGYRTTSKSTSEGENFSTVAYSIQKLTTAGSVQLMKYSDASIASSVETSMRQNGTGAVARDDKVILIVMVFPLQGNASRDLLDTLMR